VNRYRTKYQDSQQGTIGIVLNTAHFYPADPSNAADIAAAQRAYG
jgi:beta-glucosidase/6-phospho-beta-glucosidase/beta-galactosidase